MDVLQAGAKGGEREWSCGVKEDVDLSIVSVGAKLDAMVVQDSTKEKEVDGVVEWTQE